MNIHPRQRFSNWGFLIISICVLMGKAWESTLQAMDSSIHARLALEVSRGGWRPHLPMPELFADSTRPFFNDHPFTLFYLVGHFMRWVGAEAWSARLIPSLFGVLCLFMVMRLGRRWFSDRIGFFAGILLLTAPSFVLFSARFQLDPAMIFFMLCSFEYWLENRSGRAGLAAGIAVMMKSPVGFLILPTAVLTELWNGTLFRVKTLTKILLLTLCSIIPPYLLWRFANQVSGLDLLSDYWNRQVLGTAVGGRQYVQGADFFYFWNQVLVHHRIWAMFFGVGAILLFLKLVRKQLNQPAKLMLVASVVFLVVISCMRFKFPHYYLPVFPFLALLIADVFDSAFRWFESSLRKLAIAGAILLPLVLVVFPIKLAPEMFPALRKFIPYIQSEGSFSDTVLFVNHEQAYGGDGDYFVELVFYTGRKFSAIDCAHAEEKIKAVNPKWIMTSGKKIEDCISEKTAKRFNFQVKAGNQFLLGMTKNASIADLTPLYRELKVSLDGEVPSFPQDLPYRY